MGWTDRPELPQALVMDLLTLWEGAHLAPVSKQFCKLYRSRRSPDQARLLQILSTGVQGGVSSLQLMHVLRDLYDVVSKTRSAANHLCNFRKTLDTYGLEVVPTFSRVLGSVDVQAWPGCGSCVGVESCKSYYSVCETSRVLELFSLTAETLKYCRLCRWHQNLVNGAPRVLSIQDASAPCGRHGDLIWLHIYAENESNFEWVRGLLLAILQRAASVPSVSREPADIVGTGSESSGPSAPPIFVVCGEVGTLTWAEPVMWEPSLTDVTSLLWSPGGIRLPVGRFTMPFLACWEVGASPALALRSWCSHLGSAHKRRARMRLGICACTSIGHKRAPWQDIWQHLCLASPCHHRVS